MRLAVRCGGATLLAMAMEIRMPWLVVGCCCSAGASNGALCYWSRYLRNSVQLQLQL